MPSPDPLDELHPTRLKASPEVSDELNVTLPPLTPPSDLIFETPNLPDSVSEIYEWLSLIRLQSPRVASTDIIDPYLSRYQPPGESDEHTTAKLCAITWEGFLPHNFARQMLVEVILKLPSREWFSLAVSSFSKNFPGDAAECTILRPPKLPGEYLLWDVRSHV